MVAGKVVAPADKLGEKVQRTGGAAAFALQTRLGQAGFRGADGRNLAAPRVDLIGDLVAKRGAEALGKAAAAARTAEFIGAGAPDEKVSGFPEVGEDWNAACLATHWSASRFCRRTC